MWKEPKSVVEIALKNICKEYKNKNYAVRDFNLDIYDKEFVIFVGPSGCGKSTTLRMIAGLEEISDGELWIDGELSNYSEPKERDMSMVFQNYALYPSMTVYGNLAFALKVRKTPKKEIDQKVHQIAQILDIEHLLDRRPSDLSGGQKQRVAIGSAIIRRPKVFLMDEPLSNLDAKLRAQMRIELAKLHKELGITIIYVTHDQTEAMTLGTKIVVMKEGVIQQIAAPSVLHNNPINRFVAEFVGSPSMNFFEAVVQKEKDRVVLIFGEQQDKKVYPTQADSLRLKDVVGKTVQLGIRPEDIHEKAEARQGGFDTFSQGIMERVDSRELLGSEVILYFRESERNHCVRLSPDNNTAAGESIELYFDPEKIHVFDLETQENLLCREEL